MPKTNSNDRSCRGTVIQLDQGPIYFSFIDYQKRIEGTWFTVKNGDNSQRVIEFPERFKAGDFKGRKIRYRSNHSDNNWHYEIELLDGPEKGFKSEKDITSAR